MGSIFNRCFCKRRCFERIPPSGRLTIYSLIGQFRSHDHISHSHFCCCYQFLESPNPRGDTKEFLHTKNEWALFEVKLLGLATPSLFLDIGEKYNNTNLIAFYSRLKIL